MYALTSQISLSITAKSQYQLNCQFACTKLFLSVKAFLMRLKFVTTARTSNTAAVKEIMLFNVFTRKFRERSRFNKRI